MIQGFGDGGAQKQCIYLLNELQQRVGVELFLIRFHDGQVHDSLLEIENLTVYTIQTSSNYDPRNIARAYRLIRRLSPDILMSWLPCCDVYAGFIRVLSPQLKWVMTERDSSYPRALKFVIRRCAAQFADAIISNSASGDAYWARRSSRPTRFKVDNIVPGGLFASCRERPHYDAIHVGRMEPQKNILPVARAFILLAQRRPELSFAFVGEGSLRPEIERLVAEAKVDQQVELLGFQHDVASVMRRSKLVVTMSDHEGTPNVLLEAVAFNIPVLCSDISGHGDVLGKNYPHYVRERHDPDAIASRLERMLSAHETRELLREPKLRLRSMSAGAVGDAYMMAFRQIVGADG